MFTRAVRPSTLLSPVSHSGCEISANYYTEFCKAFSVFVILRQHNRFFSFLHTRLSSPRSKAGLGEVGRSRPGRLGPAARNCHPVPVGIQWMSQVCWESKSCFHLSLLHIFFLDNIQYWGNRLLSYLLPLALLCYINQLIFKVIWHIQRY